MPKRLWSIVLEFGWPNDARAYPATGAAASQRQSRLTAAVAIAVIASEVPT